MNFTRYAYPTRHDGVIQVRGLVRKPVWLGGHLLVSMRLTVVSQSVTGGMT